MSAMYDTAREAFALGDIDWADDRIDAVLVSAAYEFLSTHETIADIPEDAVVAESVEPLQGKTYGSGILGAGPIGFGRIAASDTPAIALVLYRYENGALIWYGDGGFGLPLTPNGTEVLVRQDASFGGFFQL